MTSPSSVGRPLDPAAAVTAALEFAGRGLPVFPLAGKRPVTSRGLHDATTDRDTITRWWTRGWPGANIGLRTGSGLLVVDVDGDAGEDSLYELEQELGTLPKTVSAQTGGGWHYWFRTATPMRNTAGMLGPGLDTRGDGGYIVVPPSVHPATGASYCWDNEPGSVPVARAPAWLLELLRAHNPPRHKRTPAREWVRMLDRIPEGERNHSLARLTGLLLARDLDDDVVARLVLSINQTACEPPLPACEVIRIIESILRRHLRSVAA